MGSAIGVLIGIVIMLVIIGAVWWGIQQLMPFLKLAEPFATIVRVLITIIMVLIVLWVIIKLLGIAGIHVPLPFSELPGSAVAALPFAPARYLHWLLT